MWRILTCGQICPGSKQTLSMVQRDGVSCLAKSVNSCLWGPNLYLNLYMPKGNVFFKWFASYFNFDLYFKPQLGDVDGV